MGKLELYFLTLTLLSVGSASRCPERRKPHPTSCTIFYNCINLPSGGYVWAPAKCTDGLVFQPYLRICVLPGDSWTCDILATEPPETTTTQVPELIDSTQTSYLGYGEDDVSRFSEPMDYYKIEKYTEPMENVHQTPTPYPLIEVTQPNNYVDQIDSTIKNLGVPIAIKHSEDNYLYHFVKGQQVLNAPINANNEQLQAHLLHLTQLLERLTALQGIGIPLDRQPPITTTTSTTTSTTQSPVGYNNNYNNVFHSFSNDNQDSAINFLIRNYVLKSQAQGTNSPVGTEAMRTSSLSDQEVTTSAPESVGLEITGDEGPNNIVMVKDNLNNRQYFTIRKYKSIAHQLTTETVELVPCTSGVRLPNATDCTKYYSCEPDGAKIRQYSCPSNTAFNKYKRLCERNAYTLCITEEESATKTSRTTSMARNKESTIQAADASPCQTVGKHPDPTSESHYYLCYSDNGKSTNLRYQKMVCPNSLVFCRGKNVCTTTQRCEAAAAA